MSHGVLVVASDGIRGNVATMEVALSFVFVPAIAKHSDDAPDFDVVSTAPIKGVRIGAAWRRDIKRGDSSGQEMFSITLDDPSFSRPLWVSAFPTGEVSDSGARLYDVSWRRERQQPGQRQVGGAPAGADDAIPY